MKKKINKNNVNSNVNFFAVVIIIASLFMGIGYAVVNNVFLEVGGNINVAAKQGLYISSANVYSTSNATGNIEVYDGRFFSSSVNLTTDPTLANDSYVTFEITIRNNTKYRYGYSYTNFMLGENTYDNSNIVFEVTGIDSTYVIEKNTSKTFYITFKYDDITNLSNGDLNSKVTFIFKNLDAMKLGELISINEAELGNNSSLVEYNGNKYFVGLNVNNYLWFNCDPGFSSGIDHCEKWRIISVDSNNNIKIIKENVITLEEINYFETETSFWANSVPDWVATQKIFPLGKVLYDWKELRPVYPELKDRYCIVGSNGCNAYGADSNIVGRYKDLHVDKDSLMKSYLENVYYVYGFTEEAQEDILEYTYDIGLVGIGYNLDQVFDLEDNITCTTKVGLLNVSDYLMASNNNLCKQEFTRYYNYQCIINNWLGITDYQYYLMNGKELTSNEKNAQVWTINTKKQIYSQDAALELYLKPVVVLDSNVTAIGLGTSDEENYYMIVE